MVAKIIVYDGDKEIASAERKVREIPKMDEEGNYYTDCYVELHFSRAETKEGKWL